MFCELCRVEFSSSNKKKSCKMCGSVQCSSCLRFKVKSRKPVCLDCYYDNKSLSNSDEQLHGPTASSCIVIKASNPKASKPNKSNRVVLPDKDPKTDELVKRFKQLKMNQVKAKEDISVLEYRFRRLKGLTDDKPTSSIFSLSKADPVSILMQQCVEEARIDGECGSDFNLGDDPIKPENLPSCYMCEGIAEFLCKECDDNFCKRCFNKTHNKRERFEHTTGMCKL
ncbi:hypothetical protein MN116_006666 [Schistosoma mekongi]|uniref:FYVE-type domain-containing protein n=1 Tax=Schistosoma mekongi TaxID=38744 RepID=A0AAE2D2T6_SCHME|nr:hypothetical protein MN116_006666 [Schistosoma mekongi]